MELYKIISTKVSTALYKKISAKYGVYKLNLSITLSDKLRAPGADTLRYGTGACILLNSWERKWE